VNFFLSNNLMISGWCNTEEIWTIKSLIKKKRGQINQPNLKWSCEWICKRVCREIAEKTM